MLASLQPALSSIFTARCTLVQSAVLQSHVIYRSVCLSVTLVDCYHIGWNSSEIILPLVSLGCSLCADPNTKHQGSTSGATPGNFGAKAPTHHPPVDLSVRDIRSQIVA